MQINYEVDFDLLIKASIETGNKLAGREIQHESNYIHYAEGLGKKILYHILSSKHLMVGYQLGMDGNLYEPKIDFASIAILARGALETYLTFNHLFISPQNKDERDFRFICWDIAGYIDRKDFHAKEDVFVARKENERLEIERLKKSFQENAIFKTLTSRNKERAENGIWRLDKSWSSLAASAGFDKTFFDHQYKFLCSYAHSSRLSIIQIQQNKTIAEQYEMAKSLLIILMVVLAKYTYDYIELIPFLRNEKQNMDKYPIICFWKMGGELYPPNEI